MPERRTTSSHGDRIRRNGNPDREQVEAAVLSLARGGHLILSADDETHVQVRLRPDGIYEPEHRAGSAADHHRTSTVSADEVRTAFAGWSRGDEDWAAPLTWRSIGSMFDASE